MITYLRADSSLCILEQIVAYVSQSRQQLTYLRTDSILRILEQIVSYVFQNRQYLTYLRTDSSLRILGPLKNISGCKTRLRPIDLVYLRVVIQLDSVSCVNSYGCIIPQHIDGCYVVFPLSGQTYLDKNRNKCLKNEKE